MIRLRVNAPVPAAIEAAERYSALSAELALVEHNRSAAIAATNAVADVLAAPLIAELAQLRDQIEPWFRRNANLLTAGKRRSAELGGCMLGLRAGRTSLTIAGDAAALAKVLQAKTWGKDLVRTDPSIDKAAVLKALGGRLAAKLKALGFSLSTPVDTFFLDRVDQPGVAAAD